MAGTAIVPAIASDVAMAQSERPVRTGTDANVRNLDIPPQGLSSALVAFSRQTRVQIFVDQTLASGKTSPGVSGALAPAAALNRLLAGTGLTYRFTNTTSVSIERPGTTTGAGGAAPAGAIALDTIDVEGAASSDPGRTEGTGSYTPSVTATAMRLQLSPRETPQSISVITRQQIEDFNLRSVSEVIDRTPGLSTVNQGGERTVFYARGFPVRSFQYDGVPISFQNYAGANASTEQRTDMAMYDRVEVLKGATGLLTSVGDPGATINMIRKKPTRTFQGYTTLSAGSWDDYRGELDISGALNESGTVRGRFVTAHQDNRLYLDHYHRKSSLFYGIVEVDLTPDTLFTVGSDYQRSVPKGTANNLIPLFNSLGEFNKVPRSFNPATRWSTWEADTHNIFTTLEHRFDNEWRVKLQLNRQTGGYDGTVGSASSGFPNPVDGTGVRAGPNFGIWTSKALTNAANVYATGPFWLFDRKHELVLGGSMSRQDRTRVDQVRDPASPYSNGTVPNFYNWTGDLPQPGWIPFLPGDPNKEIFKENGFYAATRLQVHDRLKVMLGARIANFEAQQRVYGNSSQLKRSGQVIPYYAAVLDLTDVLSAYASYTGVFRPQSVLNEQGATLPPLEGTNAEVGLKSAFLDGRINASAAYFQVKQDNFAVPTGSLLPGGIPAYRPVDGVITKGFELEISGQLSRQWQLQAGFTHNVSQRDSVRVSTFTPANQFTFYSTYKLDGTLDGFMVGGGARWMDKTWDNVNNPIYGTVRHTAPSYWVVDAMASYKFNEKLSATLNIRNLLDNNYYTFYGFYNGYAWGAPRSVLLSMTYRF
ncbi:TonB-dependent siderophore receptor [Nitrobacter winogradskyi]|uniref:Outer membrane receptor for ferric coprogen and ferric-rhodotorulic acid n=3 Tax=Nitrobacter winogradskyi TaxID=913 RepID=A0ACC6AQR9_NITWI|nr:TonB-dependent receptor [Nitrobacter winogradskyi]MCP2001170.1 outer membrane receptor for ferric coprogen and ferric-rhodotorulic acid [Nitrobacter winogradskyi]GEC17475.1 ferripyoverdine receptor [Nitrobacter winogradskyi]